MTENEQNEAVQPIYNDPNQVVIPNNLPELTRNDLVEYLDANFKNYGNGAGSQWRNENIWCEFNGPQFIIWNALNMRYVHHKPENVTAAIEWLKANKDKQQPVPEEYVY